MNALERKILFLRKGITQIQIVKKYGFAQASVSRVLADKAEIPEIKKAVARELGMSVKDLWPENSKPAAA